MRQLAAGRFSASACEVEFGPGKPFPPIELALSGGARCLLSGKIDRLDSFTDAAGMRFLRVIDYKTGAAKFDASIMGSSCNFRFILPPLPQRIKARGARGLPVFITCP